MSAASDQLEVDLLNAVLNNASGVWIGLSTADPLDTGLGLAEPAGGSYARVQVVSGFTVTSGATTTSGVNSAAVVFPTPTASWGTISHFAICSGVSGANVRLRGAVTVSGVATPQSVPSGVIVKFLSGTLVVTCA